jgi:hypothetical protein
VIPGGLLFAIVLGVPVGLAGWAWWRYFRVSGVTPAQRAQMFAGMLLITAATAMWLGVLALMGLQDRSSSIKAIALKTSPAGLAVINLGICLVAIVLSSIGRKSAQQTVPLRRVMIASGSILLLFWLSIALNPH